MTEQCYEGELRASGVPASVASAHAVPRRVSEHIVVVLYADDNCNTVEYDDESGTPHPHHSVTEVIRTAVQKAGCQLQEDKRRVSRQFLTNLNIAQLQVIVNDLQRYIELLNDELVQLLMERDELQMSQDATLIDIEDLSLYFSEEMMQNKHPRN
ncbi:hypothetical protein pipiens_008031 [Culex pipiens pipiens]|uniref:Schwannomin interacting protein 1 C-terminal domain-containing protein n=1 Tax=Culex pipiens pipiens TaxID=38569 RepID=A0ABD1DIT1_CULPP